MELVRKTLLPLLTLGLVLLVGCEPQEGTQDLDIDTTAVADTMDMAPQVATATLQPLSNSGVNGAATFTQQNGAVLVEANVTGLEPNSTHGFHVHENGDCGDAGQAAGDHFNPTDTPHGAPDDPDSLRHVGDLGNLNADAEGMASYNRVDSLIAFDGQASIVGKALVIHADADDLESQPSGASGDRIACGVIQMEDQMRDTGMDADTTMDME